jgi:hypothetical protein
MEAPHAIVTGNVDVMAIIAGGDSTGRVEAGSIVSWRSRGLGRKENMRAIQLEELYQSKDSPDSSESLGVRICSAPLTLPEVAGEVRCLRWQQTSAKDTCAREVIFISHCRVSHCEVAPQSLCCCWRRSHLQVPSIADQTADLILRMEGELSMLSISSSGGI